MRTCFEGRPKGDTKTFGANRVIQGRTVLKHSAHGNYKARFEREHTLTAAVDCTNCLVFLRITWYVFEKNDDTPRLTIFEAAYFIKGERCA